MTTTRTSSIRRLALLLLVRACRIAVLVWIAGAPELGAQPVPVDEAFDVNQFVTGFQNQPDVRMSNSGTAAFVWHSQEQDGDGRAIVMRKVAIDGSLFNEFVLNQATAGEQEFPRLAMNGSGDFAVTWSNGPNGGRAVAMRSSLTNGSSLAAETQANTVAGNISGSGVCRFADDTSVVVWSNGTLRFRRFGANGAAITAESDLIVIPGPANIGVACLSAGRFVAVFRADDSDGPGVFAILVDDQGAPVGEPFQVTEDPTNNQFNPVVASDGASRFVVAWLEEALLERRIELRRFFVGPAAAAPPIAFAGDQVALEVASINVNIGNIDMATDGAFVLTYDEFSDVNGPRAREYSRTGALLPGGPAIPVPAGEAASSVDAGVGLREYLLVWEAPGVATDLRARRYVRRALFSDDFETGASDGWSAVLP